MSTPAPGRRGTGHAYWASFSWLHQPESINLARAWNLSGAAQPEGPRETSVTEPITGPGDDPIQVTPVVVLVQVFPARPSSIPDIRDFVRRCLAESPLTEEGTRQVGETVFRALLDAAGPTGSIQVAFRIFP